MRNQAFGAHVRLQKEASQRTQSSQTLAEAAIILSFGSPSDPDLAPPGKSEDELAVFNHSLAVDFDGSLHHGDAPGKVGLILSAPELIVANGDENHARGLPRPVVAAAFHNFQGRVQSNLKGAEHILVAAVGSEERLEALRITLRLKRIHLAILELIGGSCEMICPAALIATGWSEPVAAAPLWTSAFHGAPGKPT
jgi:hypothetical protein